MFTVTYNYILTTRLLDTQLRDVIRSPVSMPFHLLPQWFRTKSETRKIVVSQLKSENKKKKIDFEKTTREIRADGPAKKKK